MKYKSLLVVGLLSGLVASALTALLFGYVGSPNVVVIQEDNRQATYTSSSHSEYSHSEYSLPPSFSPIVNKTKESVVAIKAITEQKRTGTTEYTMEMGSGVIFSPQGYVITNYHVIKNANILEVKLPDHREYIATLQGYDQATDLAILKIEEDNLPHIIFGNSDSLAVGEWVLAIGNPYRLHSSVTAGIVSAKARDINILEKSGIESFIQTDAAINQGNSGGALINMYGKLVGINTAIITDSGNYEGFSFAIPVNLVKKVVYDILEFGTVQRGWLGISLSAVNDEISKQNGMSKPQGVRIDLVQQNSAASAAKLSTGDIITGVNGSTITSSPHFMEVVAQYSPGDVLQLDVIRSGTPMSKEVTLRNYLNTTEIVLHSNESILREIGVDIRNLTTEELSISHGVRVISILSGSKIHSTNMQSEFIITHVNKKKVENITDFTTLLQQEDGVIILEGIYEDYPGRFPYKFVK